MRIRGNPGEESRKQLKALQGKKSLAIAVTLQPTTHTLTDAEIEAVAAKIVAQVGKATGGVLRG